jgi:hypothetical protein
MACSQSFSIGIKVKMRYFSRIFGTLLLQESAGRQWRKVPPYLSF